MRPRLKIALLAGVCATAFLVAQPEKRDDGLLDARPFGATGALELGSAAPPDDPELSGWEFAVQFASRLFNPPVLVGQAFASHSNGGGNGGDDDTDWGASASAPAADPLKPPPGFSPIPLKLPLPPRAGAPGGEDALNDLLAAVKGLAPKPWTPPARQAVARLRIPRDNLDMSDKGTVFGCTCDTPLRGVPACPKDRKPDDCLEPTSLALGGGDTAAASKLFAAKSFPNLASRPEWAIKSIKY